MGDYYKLLGLQRSATAEDIKREYRKLALQLHPDKCTVPQTDEAFKKVARAFQCLSDENKRRMYDQFGESRDEEGFNSAYESDELVSSKEVFEAFFREVIDDKTGRR